MTNDKVMIHLAKVSNLSLAENPYRVTDIKEIIRDVEYSSYEDETEENIHSKIREIHHLFDTFASSFYS